MPTRILPFLLCSCLLLNGYGCATLMNGKHQTISLETTPPGAMVKLEDREFSSPLKLELRRSVMNKTFEISKEGYMPKSVTLRSKKSGWTTGNLLLLLAAVVGLKMDIDSGAAFVYEPGKIRVTLTRLEDAKDKKVEVRILDLSMLSPAVRPGGQFGFKVEYTIEDNTTLDNPVPLGLDYAILRERKVLFEDALSLRAPRQVRFATTKGDLVAGRAPGTYILRITIRYKDHTARQAIPFNIQ